MIHHRSIFTVVVLALCVVAQAQVPVTGPKTKEQPVTGTIDGKVVNENGQPLAGAAVFVRTVNSLINRSTSTDLDGNFRVNGLETGIYSVVATSPAYTSAPGDPDAPNYYRLGDSARVELVRGGAITGTVTNAIGEPVIAVRVRAIMVRDAKGQAARSPGFMEQPTDDRGIYRIYGLAPGTYIVSAGGSSFLPSLSAYETDVPTFAPSSTRDTAAEVSVRSGEDVSVDIRYRGEPGHSVSGSVKALGTNNVSIALMRPGSGVPVATTIQVPAVRGFIFNGLADGDYDLVAQESIVNQTTPVFPALAVSEPKRVKIRGTDVTGIELVTKTLGSISGKILLEPAKVPECEGKRPPLMAEMLMRYRRPEKEIEKDPAQTFRAISASVPVDTAGAFVFRNLQAGSYQFESRFYARYWYLQSVTLNGAGPKSQRVDAAANWTMLKSGEQLSNLTITLAEGAASIRGKVTVAEAESPPAVVVYLIPNERDKVDDVLRHFITEVAADGTFTFNSIPPGKYLVLPQTIVEPQLASLTKLRQPDATAARTKLRRTAETKKAEIELKPCQNLSDYQLKQ